MNFDQDPALSADSPNDETHVPYPPLPSEKPQEPASQPSPAPVADSQAADTPPSSLLGDTTANQPRNSPAPWFYEGAILVSAFSIILTFVLVVAGFSGFDGPTYGKPWCYGNGLPIFSGTGFALLVLSILSASIALVWANKAPYYDVQAKSRGAIICLVISIIGLPLFGVCCLGALVGCAG